MRISWLILALSVCEAAHSEITLQATRVDHVLVLNDVFLDGKGPFRMMIDTGNTSSLIRPEVAQRLKVQPTYVVEHATVAGTRIAPVVILNDVRAGGIADASVEAIVGDSSLAGVDGVLGQSWLVRHDYLLDYRNRRVVIDGVPLADGLREGVRSVFRTTLRSSDGRPVVVGEVNGQQRELLLDSGAPTVVLFDPSSKVRHGVILRTNGDSTNAEEGWAQIAIEGDQARRMRTVRVNSTVPTLGLLPASAFAAVFVSNHHGFVELSRR